MYRIARRRLKKRVFHCIYVYAIAVIDKKRVLISKRPNRLSREPAFQRDDTTKAGSHCAHDVSVIAGRTGRSKFFEVFNE